jgi:hypothetical protein
MAKKGSARRPTATRKPAPVQGAPAPAAPDTKTRARSAPIDTALRHAKLIDLHARHLHRLTGNWQGEATEDQTVTNAEIVLNLGKLAPLAAQVLLDVDMLKQTGFKPIAARGSAIPLAAGEKVVIKAKYFNETLYGKVNNFEVVVAISGHVRIKSAADARAPQLVVPRAYLEAVDEIPVDESLPETDDTVTPEGEEPLEDDLANDLEDGRDPRLPNPDED